MIGRRGETTPTLTFLHHNNAVNSDRNDLTSLSASSSYRELIRYFLFIGRWASLLNIDLYDDDL